METRRWECSLCGCYLEVPCLKKSMTEKQKIPIREEIKKIVNGKGWKWCKKIGYEYSGIHCEKCAKYFCKEYKLDYETGLKLKQS